MTEAPTPSEAPAAPEAPARRRSGGRSGRIAARQAAPAADERPVRPGCPAVGSPL